MTVNAPDSIREFWRRATESGDPKQIAIAAQAVEAWQREARDTAPPPDDYPPISEEVGTGLEAPPANEVARGPETVVSIDESCADEQAGIEIRHNNCSISREPCAGCGIPERAMVGPAVFVTGTWNRICDRCAQARSRWILPEVQKRRLQFMHEDLRQSV